MRWLTVFLLVTEHYLGKQIKGNELSRTCRMHESEEKYIQSLDRETRRDRMHYLKNGCEDNIKTDLTK
jgi:hypothetical protein